MSWKVAFGTAGGAFLLSFISAGLGGSDLGSMFLRALFFGVLACGAALGVEWLLRTLLPELFQAVTPTEEPDTPRVDITLEPEPEFVREMSSEKFEESVEDERPQVLETTPVSAQESLVKEEDLPEIGSFLASFGPEGAPPTPTASAETFTREPDRTPTGDVILDGIAHDPTVLAKAVQTVLKKGQ